MEQAPLADDAVMNPVQEGDADGQGERLPVAPVVERGQAVPARIRRRERERLRSAPFPDDRPEAMVAPDRDKLRRAFKPVKTPFGTVTVKIGTLDGRVVQASPEYESCRKLSERAKVSLRQIYEAAAKAIKAKP